MPSRTTLGPAFGRLLAASTAANLGDGVLLAAVPLLARSLTRDPVAVSAVTVAATLPWLLFGLPAGALIDRWNRLRTMVLAGAGRALLLAAVTALVAGGGMTVAWLAIAVFVLGAAESVADTAAQAWLPAIVAPADLEAANGRLFGAQVAANTLAGPALGAAMFGAGAVVPFAFNAGAFALSTGLLATQPAAAAAVSATRPRAPLHREIVEGLAWVWADRGVRAFAVGAAVVNLAHTAALAVAVLLLRDTLGLSPLGYGVTLSGAAVGAVVGAHVAAATVRRAGRRQAALGAVALFALSLVVAGLAPHAAVVSLALAVFGAAGEIWNVVAVSYRQARVPPHLLGRVMATYRFVAYGAMPVGAAAGGLVAKAISVRATFVVGGLLVAGLLGYLAPALHGALAEQPRVAA